MDDEQLSTYCFPDMVFLLRSYLLSTSAITHSDGKVII